MEQALVATEASLKADLEVPACLRQTTRCPVGAGFLVVPVDTVASRALPAVMADLIVPVIILLPTCLVEATEDTNLSALASPMAPGCELDNG